MQADEESMREAPRNRRRLSSAASLYAIADGTDEKQKTPPRL
jgi:hypothetical protein